MAEATSVEIRPNFIIIGAAKCGTTSLQGILKGHPEIFMCEPKEPCFFLDPRWDRPGLPRTVEEYLALFSPGAGRRAIGEASANYLFVPGTAQRIRELLGNDLKLIVMLRHPVNMLYSLWEHNCRGGWENRPAREALLSSSFDEPVILSEGSPYGGSCYARRADYASQIEEYLRFFPRENMKVYIFEEFYAPGRPLFPEMLSFLGVDTGFIPSNIELNKGIGLSSNWLNRFFHSYYPEHVFPVVRYFVPHAVRKRVRAGIMRTAKWQESRANAPVRRELEKRLHGSVRRLEALLGRDLSRVWF